jgi:hypothetical protein
MPGIFVVGAVTGFVQVYTQTKHPIAFLFILFLVPGLLLAFGTPRRVIYDDTKIVVYDFRHREQINLRDIKSIQFLRGGRPFSIYPSIVLLITDHGNGVRRISFIPKVKDYLNFKLFSKTTGQLKRLYDTWTECTAANAAYK